MAEETGDEEKASDRVMILFMGGSHEHAITSIQHFVPDAVHIITSDKYDKAYRRRLREWSQKYKFRRGTVQAVSDLFEPSSVSSLIGCAWSVAGHEHNLSGGKMATYLWTIGITGGTMHMAAVASLVAGVLDAHAFYVIKPEEGTAIMPNRDIIMLPGIHALKMAMALNPLDLVLAQALEHVALLPDLLLQDFSLLCLLLLLGGQTLREHLLRLGVDRLVQLDSDLGLDMGPQPVGHVELLAAVWARD